MQDVVEAINTCNCFLGGFFYSYVCVFVIFFIVKSPINYERKLNHIYKVLSYIKIN